MLQRSAEQQQLKSLSCPSVGLQQKSHPIFGVWHPKKDGSFSPLYRRYWPRQAVSFFSRSHSWMLQTASSEFCQHFSALDGCRIRHSAAVASSRLGAVKSIDLWTMQLFFCKKSVSSVIQSDSRVHGDVAISTAYLYICVFFDLSLVECSGSGVAADPPEARGAVRICGPRCGFYSSRAAVNYCA